MATQHPAVAILCLGDTAFANNALPLTPVFGQPLFHHVIKRLQALHLQRFLIHVENVSPALLSYRDEAAALGLQVDFVRSPDDIIAQASGADRYLVLRLDHLWDTHLLAAALSVKSPMVATVEERGENSAFERIDLNHRWAGLCVLERKTVQALAELPGDWDLASALMRRAVQESVIFWPVPQIEVDAGGLLALRTQEELERAQARLMPTPAAPNDTVETRLLGRIVPQLTTRLWTVKHGRNVALLAFPAISLFALLAALMGFALSAAIIAILAVVASPFRLSVRTVEYRADTADPLMMASWASLGVALLAVLAFDAMRYLDPVWLGLLLLGLMASAAKERHRFSIASPLVVAAVIVAGLVMGLMMAMLQALILVEIGLIVIHRWRSASGTLAGQQP